MRYVWLATIPGAVFLFIITVMIYDEVELWVLSGLITQLSTVNVTILGKFREVS